MKIIKAILLLHLVSRTIKAAYLVMPYIKAIGENENSLNTNYSIYFIGNENIPEKLEEHKYISPKIVCEKTKNRFFLNKFEQLKKNNYTRQLKPKVGFKSEDEEEDMPIYIEFHLDNMLEEKNGYLFFNSEFASIHPNQLLLRKKIFNVCHKYPFIPLQEILEKIQNTHIDNVRVDKLYADCDIVYGKLLVEIKIEKTTFVDESKKDVSEEGKEKLLDIIKKISNYPNLEAHKYFYESPPYTTKCNKNIL